MKKTYKSKLRGYNIFVSVNGETVDIEFKKGFVIGNLRGCVYATEDKNIQKSIESHPAFGVKFWTDDVEKKETLNPAPVKEETTEKKSRRTIKE